MQISVQTLYPPIRITVADSRRGGEAEEEKFFLYKIFRPLSCCAAQPG